MSAWSAFSSLAELASVRRDQRRRPRWPGQQVLAPGQHREAVGIDEHGQRRRQYRGEQRRSFVIGAQPGPGDPRLYPPSGLDCGWPGRLGRVRRIGHRDDGLGPVLPDDVGSGPGRDEPDHARAAAYRAADAEHCGARVALAARQDAEHAAPVLVGLSTGPWKQLGDVGGLQRGHGRCCGQVRPEADVDELNGPRVARTRIHQQARA